MEYGVAIYKYAFVFLAGAVMLGPQSEIPAKVPCGFGNIAITPQPGTFHHLPWVTDGKYKVNKHPYNTPFPSSY